MQSVSSEIKISDLFKISDFEDNETGFSSTPKSIFLFELIAKNAFGRSHHSENQRFSGTQENFSGLKFSVQKIPQRNFLALKIKNF